MNSFIDMTGQKFGRLTVIRRVPNLPNSRITRWECLCDCGNTTFTSRPNLLHGHSTSCGCLALEFRKYNKYRETHGKSRTRLYHIWQGIKQRCIDKNSTGYKHYGGKGVCICNEWLDFCVFQEWALLNRYNDSLTIDRINPTGNYSSENCRWITTKEQNRNKTNNRVLKLNKITKCIGEWSEELNIPINTIINRLNRGCSIKEALNPNYIRRDTSK